CDILRRGSRPREGSCDGNRCSRNYAEAPVARWYRIARVERVRSLRLFDEPSGRRRILRNDGTRCGGLCLVPSPARMVGGRVGRGGMGFGARLGAAPVTIEACRDRLPRVDRRGRDQLLLPVPFGTTGFAGGWNGGDHAGRHPHPDRGAMVLRAPPGSGRRVALIRSSAL